MSDLITSRDRLERRDLVERAWERFVKDDLEPVGMPAEVASSWHRARERFGIAPDLAEPRLSLTDDELAIRREVDVVYRLARPILDEFAEGLSAHCLVYLDASGHVLSVDGDPAVVDAVRGIHFRPGVTWSEESAGTNGPGTALACRRPIEIFAAEHFVHRYHAWSCAAAPIMVPDEEAPLAVVDVTGPWHLHSRQALHVAKAVACVVRERLMAARSVRAEVIRHTFRTSRHSGDPLACVDSRGNFIALNDAALRRRVFTPGTMDTALRVRLERAVFAASARAGDEVELELPDGRACVATPVRFGEMPVGAILRLPDSGARSRPSARARPGARHDFRSIQGTSDAIGRALELARAAARVELPVVLTGESGTGKELFAQAIHAGGPRRDGPFVPVNCGAIPESLIEAELFGYEDGAFTGARRGGSAGRFEDAHGGTLFLDEVSELPAHAQAALLRLLQEREVVRVGSGTPRAIDVRVVAATNEPLADEVQAGRFRHDLYFRLNVLHVRVPPLRERGEDVVLLAKVFLEEAAGQVGRSGLALTPGALEAIRRHPWPGNVRELRNVVLRAAATTAAQELEARHLGLEAPQDAAGPAGADETLRAAKEESERLRLLEALESTGWNFVHAAKRLDVSRMTLYRLVKKHGIERTPRKR